MQLTTTTIDGYCIKIAHDYNLEELENQWISIQGNQDIPFFLTWSWISCWLKTYNPEIIVVSALYEDQIVAIGLFTRSNEGRHGFVSSHQYRLHQMGDPLLDQIWMEYNDFICDSKHKVNVVNACLKALMESSNEWDEIVLSMMSESRTKEISHIIPDTQIIAENPCYALDLQQLQKTNTDYLSLLKANTRYQIRRSMRLYEKLHGELVLTVAQNEAEAQQFFLEAKSYHIARWDDSGYKNNQFILFHQNLIKNSFASHSIDLIKVSSGDTLLAILYYHIVNKHVFFYLHGLNYESDYKLKPGLVAHTLATQHYQRQGMHSYDYMGGYSQYKCQLASETESQVSLCIQRSKLQFKIEKIGQKIKGITSKTGQSS